MIRSLKVFITLIAMLTLTGGSVMADGGSGMPPAAGEKVMLSVPLGDYSLEAADGSQTISMTGFGQLLVPGKPKLPSRIFAIAIPPGTELVAVDYQLGPGTELPGTYDIQPAPLPRAIGEEDPILYERDRQEYESSLRSVYGSDDPYPEQVVRLVRTAGYREYNLADVRVTPFQYRPLSRTLTYYPQITVIVTYRLSQDRSYAQPALALSSHCESRARDIILNYDQTADWYLNAGQSRELHDYVIITIPSLTSAVTLLADAETGKGRNVEIVTTDWIDLSYSGYDLAAKIREFLRDKYSSAEWGIEDVLLVGDYDDVPMRRTAQDLGYGAPETDFYYAELSLPDSLSWDSDQDHNYGEDSDQVDFYSEVIVGRIPWSDPMTVQTICAKSIAYEQNNDPAFKHNMLLMGAYFWADTDNAVLMEYKVDATLHPWMAAWTLTRMYEKNSGYWSGYDCDYPLLQSNVMDVWPDNTYAFVNWAGHGSPTSCHIYGLGAPAFIESSDCAQLNDSYPAIIFADACSNSDTDYPNIGRAMLQHGAVGFVGATKVAYGCGAWQHPNDGSSQSLDYHFTTAVTSCEYSQGGALQHALTHMYTHGLWDDVEYETFEWGALWGNPNLWMGNPPMLLAVPGSVPEFAAPGTETTIVVEIEEGGDSYIPGSGLMYYRLDGSDYLTSPLVHVEGNLYEATLPVADCEDTLEYYFVAEGDSCGTLYCPPGAPATTYVTFIGELTENLSDDFESDNGWTVENSPDLTDGPWDRGAPAGGGDRGDPPADFDGSGQCFLTDNVDDNSDVDDGTTSLISPMFDLTQGKGRISYARWYSNNTGDDPNNDVMEIYISSDGGANWTLVETVGPTQQAGGGWFQYSFWVDDLIVPTDQMRMRFDASDLSSGSVVEAGIDDFRVMVFDCAVPYICGDADCNEIVNISDAVYLIEYIFGGGPAPDPLESGEVDCNALVNISDAVYLVQYIFGGGPEPCAECP